MVHFFFLLFFAIWRTAVCWCFSGQEDMAAIPHFKHLVASNVVRNLLDGTLNSSNEFGTVCVLHVYDICFTSLDMVIQAG